MQLRDKAYEMEEFVKDVVANMTKGQVEPTPIVTGPGVVVEGDTVKVLDDRKENVNPDDIPF
jgi:hypothetical protein